MTSFFDDLSKPKVLNPDPVESKPVRSSPLSKNSTNEEPGFFDRPVPGSEFFDRPVPGTEPLPNINTTDMTPGERLNYYRTLNDPHKDVLGTINDRSLERMSFEEKQKLAGQILTAKSASPSQAFLESWVDTAANPPSILPGITNPGQLSSGPTDSFVRNTYDSGHYAYTDELTGFYKTLIQAAYHPDRWNSPSDLVQMYQDNRDVSRAIHDDEIRRYPIASMLGQVAGGFGAPAPAAITGAVKATNALNTLKQSGKIAAWYGTLYGSGYSEADLTKGEYLPFTRDVATSIGAVLGLGLTANAALSRIKASGRMNYLTDPLGAEGAVYNVASGQGARSVPDKILSKMPKEDMSKAAKAIGTAREYNIVDLKPYGIRNAEGQLSGAGGELPVFSKLDSSNPAKWLKNQFTTFKEYYLHGNEFNYQHAKDNLDDVVIRLQGSLDDMYERGQAAFGKSHDINSIFAKDVRPSIMKSIRQMEKSSDTAEGAQILQNMLDELSSSGKVNTLSELRGIKQQLGASAGFEAGAARKGTAKAEIQGIYHQINNYIDDVMRQALPEEVGAYKKLNSDLSNLQTFDQTLYIGSKAKGMSLLSKPETHGFGVSEGGSGNGVFAGVADSLKGGPIKALGRLIGNVAGTAVRPIAGSLTASPTTVPLIVNQIFPSYKERKLHSMEDRQLGSVYIDSNGHLSARDKTKQKQILHSTGDFDLSNIPTEVKNS